MNNGCFALVDDEDYERVTQRKWRLHGNPADKTQYAAAHVRIDGKAKRELMHRFILQAKPGQTIDHKNRNGLDNRKSNLRYCTLSQNQANTETRTGSSRFRGVSWYKPTKKWRVKVGKNGFVGYYSTEEEAARIYNEKAVKRYGEFATLNHI